MLAKRIIPCLDVKNGRTVKGINFTGLRDAGDPIELATWYASEGADELVFLDVSATLESRGAFTEVISQVAQAINIPFTVGGGITSVESAKKLIRAGADKVSVNSAAVKRPELISELAQEFGSQAVVVAVDAACNGKEWVHYTHSASKNSGRAVLSWVTEAVERGAGEILLTSINNDGTKNGFALELTKAVSTQVPIPVIASGGAGSIGDFVRVFKEGLADAALAASVFHYREIGIRQLKLALQNEGIEVRYEA